MLTTQQIMTKYGQPGPNNLIIVPLPYPMKIAWDLRHTTSRLQCHKLVASNFQAVFTDILSHYGLPEIQRLSIDLYGGCYNYRKMRGGSDWSRHSWGIAIDLCPERNALKTPFKQALFSKPEYEPMMNIFYSHGFFNLGREKGYDAMHFEIRQ